MSKSFDPFANQYNGGGERSREDPIYRGDLEPELVARIQQLRCCAAQSSGNEEIFAGAVLALLGVIPPQVRYAVEDAENEATEKIAEVVAELRKTVTEKEPPTDMNLVRIVRMIMAVKSSTYSEETEEWDYQVINGIKLGTPEHPYYTNRPGDLDYNPALNGGQPILVSPIMKMTQKVDYYRLFMRIGEELTNFGLGWELESITEELGKIPKKDPPPTPTLEEGVELTVDDDPEADEVS